MKAFVEVLSVIVRAGPDCDAYGKPFTLAVGASAVDGKTAIVKALVNPDLQPTDGKEFIRASRAILRALQSPLPPFQAVDWERIKGNE